MVGNRQTNPSKSDIGAQLQKSQTRFLQSFILSELNLQLRRVTEYVDVILESNSVSLTALIHLTDLVEFEGLKVTL